MSAGFVVRRRGDPFTPPEGLRVVEVCKLGPCEHPGCVEGHELRTRSCDYCGRPIATHPARFITTAFPVVAHIACIKAAEAHPAPELRDVEPPEMLQELEAPPPLQEVTRHLRAVVILLEAHPDVAARLQEEVARLVREQPTGFWGQLVRAAVASEPWPQGQAE